MNKLIKIVKETDFKRINNNACGHPRYEVDSSLFLVKPRDAKLTSKGKYIITSFLGSMQLATNANEENFRLHNIVFAKNYYHFIVKGVDTSTLDYIDLDGNGYTLA